MLCSPKYQLCEYNVSNSSKNIQPIHTHYLNEKIMEDTIFKQLNNYYQLKKISYKNLPGKNYKDIEDLAIIFYQYLFAIELNTIPKNPIIAQIINLNSNNSDTNNNYRLSNKQLTPQSAIKQKYQQIFVAIQNKKSNVMDYIGCLICLIGDYILLQESQQGSDFQNRNFTENTLAIFFKKLTELKMQLKQYLYILYTKLTININVSVESVQCIFKKFIKAPLKSNSHNFNAKMKFMTQWQVISKNMKKSKVLIGQNRYAKSKRNLMRNNSYATQLRSILKEAEKQVQDQRKKEKGISKIPKISIEGIISNQSSQKHINSNITSYMVSNATSYRNSHKNLMTQQSSQEYSGISKIKLRLKKLTNCQERSEKIKNQLNQSFCSNSKNYQQNTPKQNNYQSIKKDQDRSIEYWEKYLKQLKDHCYNKCNKQSIMKLNKSDYLPLLTSKASPLKLQEIQEKYIRRDSKMETKRDKKGSQLWGKTKQDNQSQKQGDTLRKTIKIYNKMSIQSSQLHALDGTNQTLLNATNRDQINEDLCYLDQTQNSIQAKTYNQKCSQALIQHKSKFSSQDKTHSYTTRIDIPKNQNKQNQIDLMFPIDLSLTNNNKQNMKLEGALHKNPRKLKKQMERFLTHVRLKQY